MLMLEYAEQQGQCTYNVRLWRFRVYIVTMKKRQYCPFYCCWCVCCCQQCKCSQCHSIQKWVPFAL